MLSCITRCIRGLSRRQPPFEDVGTAYRTASDTAGTSAGLTLEKVAALLQADNAKVVVMAGAGISVSAGIPDFRSPGTGLYDNLAEYGLPYPEAVFDLGFYRQTPRPFQRLCRELWPGNFAPTPTHAFFKVLDDKGKLLRCFTQNIDSLESAAGLAPDRVVAAHGNFDAAHVVGSGQDVPVEEVKAAAFGGPEDWDALAAKHGGLVKPSIVFFGENLPRRFFQLASSDLPQCNLLLVLGTSLAVHPFAGLVDAVPHHTPRLLVNRERVGSFSGPSDGFVQGDCDEAVHQLCGLLGWEAELEGVLEASKAKV